MFRKPRGGNTSEVLVASVGRPPTPPSLKTKTPNRNSKSVPQERHIAASTKSKLKANQSILSFFKKETSPHKSFATSGKGEEEALFFGCEDTLNSKEQTAHEVSLEPLQIPTPPSDHSQHWSHEVPEKLAAERYNEISAPVKRRRTGAGPIGFLRPKVASANETEEVVETKEQAAIRELLGDSNNDEGRIGLLQNTTDAVTANRGEHICLERGTDGVPETLDSYKREWMKDSTRSCFSPDDCQPNDAQLCGSAMVPEAPSLKRESTIYIDIEGFEGVDDFIDDEFPEEGEEYQERQWMDEQFLQEQDLEVEGESNSHELGETTNVASDGSSCPICNIDLTGTTDEDAIFHVNNCLDGNPTPLPLGLKREPQASQVKVEKQPPPHKRFQRSAIARPGQENPFSFAAHASTASSAFSKIMSSHAEDAAWATAAATESASRGKAAYQRTCPFYKILPGLYICVDAFRYGAVEGCEAYFLSHFHSDHYIGLTSSWCHGPIYCSHVTANLVRRQLRVDPKWVVDLEFEQTVEVPNTQGVQVTMIPANHCPGSSLYLFEKVVGKGKTPRTQRVLHCGDFRACPAHVQHPLLRPDVVDVVTGKNARQQKLDVCYLDTTYLTPKYAFPSQEEVIRACADMCVSLSKERVDENDDWETTKKERAGSGMVKFVHKDSSVIKEEDGEEEDDVYAMKVGTRNNGKKARGKLLVICGTYSIGKERICLGIARALNCKIYAPPNKQRICAALEDPELSARLTSDPFEAQVHMQMIMEIRAETLADYLTQYKPYFSRIVGFRPSGWNYRPPNSRFTESPLVTTVLHSDNWKSKYSMAELVPQRGSTREASCFGVPYSEHSSFRELTMFCCALRIDKIIPTVNVGSAKSREKMKIWCDKWAMHKKKNGLYKVQDGQEAW